MSKVLKWIDFIYDVIVNEQIRGRVRQAQTGLKMHARPFGDEIAGRVEDLISWNWIHFPEQISKPQCNLDRNSTR